MTIEDFIKKWDGQTKPVIKFKFTEIFIDGQIRNTIVFEIPFIAEWVDEAQKSRFYEHCKKVNVKRVNGRNRKYYHKSW